MCGWPQFEGDQRAIHARHWVVLEAGDAEPAVMGNSSKRGGYNFKSFRFATLGWAHNLPRWDGHIFCHEGTGTRLIFRSEWR
eukprot:65018-Pelagomonas_calceolata.AAC.1